MFYNVYSTVPLSVLYSTLITDQYCTVYTYSLILPTYHFILHFRSQGYGQIQQDLNIDKRQHFQIHNLHQQLFKDFL